MIPPYSHSSPEQIFWEYDNFLIKVIGCWGDGCIKDVPEIIEAHGRLCQLVQDELQMAARDTVGSQEGRKENHEEWVGI